MEWFHVAVWFVPITLTGIYMVFKKVVSTLANKKLSPPLRAEYSTARYNGQKDMAEALFNDIRDKILYQLRKIVHDPHRGHKNKSVWRGRYDVYAGAYFDAGNYPRMIELTAEMIYNYELIMKDVYNFDLSLGQQNTTYLGSDSENEYEAYIQGGLKYLDKIDNRKLQNLEKRDKIERRRQGLKEINHRWATVNEELTRLRNQPIEYDAKKAFDKELNS